MLISEEGNLRLTSGLHTHVHTHTHAHKEQVLQKWPRTSPLALVAHREPCEGVVIVPRCTVLALGRRSSATVCV